LSKQFNIFKLNKKLKLKLNKRPNKHLFKKLNKQTWQQQQQWQQQPDSLAPGAPAARAPVHFSLSPAQVFNDIINYPTSDGMKLYSKATTLQKIEYNGSSEGLRLVLETFRDSQRDHPHRRWKSQSGLAIRPAHGRRTAGM
jgi:hypothetical protein